MWNTNVWQSKTCIVINNKSQGEVAAHLRCGGLFTYHFITYLSLFGSDIFLIFEHLAMFQAKGLTVPMRPVCTAMFWLRTDCWLNYDGTETYCSCYIIMLIIFYLFRY